MLKKFILIIIIILNYNTPIISQDNNTKKIAVLEIIDKDNAFSTGIKLLLRSKLTNAIINVSGYTAYDRVDIKSILDEQEFQHSGLVSDEQIKKMGKFAGVDYILISEIMQFDAQNVFITAKILNTETAKLEQITNISSGLNSKAIELSCTKLANKLLTIKTTAYINGNMYIGETLNGKPHGIGTMTYRADDPKGRIKYYGQWAYGQCNGEGSMHYTNGVYYGEFANNDRCGLGRYFEITLSREDNFAKDYIFKYEGEWSNDLYNGKGRLTYRNTSDDIKYIEGYWDNGQLNGECMIMYNNEDKEIAWYSSGIRNGYAEYHFLEGGIIKGYYNNDNRDGEWIESKNGQQTGYKYKNGVIKKKYIIKD